MLKERLFIVPVRTERKIVTEYRMYNRKPDYRTKFVKLYGQYIVDTDSFHKAFKESNAKAIYLFNDESKITFPSLDAAYKFAKMIGR